MTTYPSHPTTLPTGPGWSGPPPPLWLPHYGIDFRAAIARCLQKYATFDGRASLSEFWFWTLFRMLVAAATMVVYFVLAAVATAGDDVTDGTSVAAVSVVGLLLVFILATELPTLAITTRRLHDVGYSGGWMFISCIPTIGSLILICLLAKNTQRAAMTYGPPFVMVDPSRPSWAPQHDPGRTG